MLKIPLEHFHKNGISQISLEMAASVMDKVCWTQHRQDDIQRWKGDGGR